MKVAMERCSTCCRSLPSWLLSDDALGGRKSRAGDAPVR
jgi:hypothetical protein